MKIPFRITVFLFGLFSFGTGLLTSACVPRSKSELKNTFDIDEALDPKGNARRHRASELEANWTVAVPGCGSAILLDAAHLLTAEHCKVRVGSLFTSGIRSLNEESPDLRVKKLLESNSELDYVIVEVEWIRSMPSQQKFPPYIAIKPSEVIIKSDPGEGDFIYAVGFPNDKNNIWPVTYAEGQAKHLYKTTLVFDIGVINGNSGSGILKKDNNMLVGIVLQGSKNFGEEGWDKNDFTDPEQWNWGTTTWDIYAVSPVLKALFPDGKHHQLAQLFVPRTRLYLAIEAQENSGSNYLWASVGFEADTVVLCPASANPCQAGGTGAEKLIYREEKQDRKFFRTSRAKSSLDNKSYSLAAYDKSGKLLAKRRIKIKQKD